MSNKGRLIILSAPSGTGKTTVTKRLLSLLPNTVHSISYTNRPRRFGEKEGEHYHFVDTKTFEKMIQGGKLTDRVSLYFNTDYPLKLEYKVTDRLLMSFILAPRVDND